MLGAWELTERWEVAACEPALPVTEKSNPRTRDIDRALPAQMVQLLQDCDAEIFQHQWKGESSCPGIYSDSVVQTLVHVAKKVEDILKDPEDSVIVMSGCGTSGRLAYLLVTFFNKLLKGLQRPQIFTYIIAGGDKAILTSQEAPEDCPQLGVRRMEEVCTGKRHVLFMGISCGLSAPFVAGQLDFCMNNLHIFTPVLIGFNPVNMARNEPIPGWPLTFWDVTERMAEMQKTHRAFIINPVVGPEPISGSSRMKGGSATKILLETLLWAGHTAAVSHTSTTHIDVLSLLRNYERVHRTTYSQSEEIAVLVKQAGVRDVLSLLRNYERVHRTTYSQSEEIAVLVKQAGVSLQEGRHVYYVGWHTLGVIGIIDASECIPTFGADVDDVRGFVSEGFAEMSNVEGDISSLGPEFCIGHKDFVSSILPHVNQSDTVIFLFTLDDDLDMAEDLALRVKQKTSNLHAVTHSFGPYDVPDRMKDVFASVMSFVWPSGSSEDDSCFPMMLQAELCTKWILNAVSTGAHILKGKIYRNYMMDLKVTNSKLFRRAISLLQILTSCPVEQCHRALLQAIYGTEQPTKEMNTAALNQHTHIANTSSRVVPTALVMLRWSCSLGEARKRLSAHSLIKDAVEACLATSTNRRTTDTTAMRAQTTTT